MNKDETLRYQPENARCQVCKKWFANCEGLSFEEMLVIKATSDGVKVVRCAEFVRLPDAP